MLWLKKASGILIIFQLLLGAGGTFVAESVNDTSQESLYTKDLNTETSDSEETSVMTFGERHSKMKAKKETAQK